MKTFKMRIHPGQSITDAVREAAEVSTGKNATVEFTFNDVKVTVPPNSKVEDVVAKWDADREAAHQAWINSDEYKERERKRAEEYAAKCAAIMVDTSNGETEMREADVPWPLTEKQLVEYINSLINRNHDYGTCVYAMSMAAVAAFYYVSHKLGVTGFQASCADLDILRRTRSMKGPFIILKGEDALYPQCDPAEKFAEAMESWKPWLKEQAQKKIEENGVAHSAVVAHWHKLASLEVPDAAATKSSGGQ